MAERQFLKKLEIELRRNTDNTFTPWQIQDFIAKLASTYYKLDLINTISNKINSGVKKENIFIIDESFKYSNNYDFLEKSNKLNLNDEKEFKNFYHFGNPVSMFPSITMIDIMLKFKLFRDLNKCLGARNIEKIDKKSFHEIVFESTIEESRILKLALKNIDSIDRDKKNRIETDLKEINEKYKNIFNTYIKDELKINLFKSIIEVDKLEKEELDEYQSIEDTYFKEFMRYFNRLDRPIIGVYSPDTNRVELLGSSFINKKSRDERFLDIKEISHNSPPYCHLFIGLAFVTPTIILIKNIIESNMKNISANTNQNKIEKLKEKNNTYNESIKELGKLLEEEQLEEYKAIANEYMHVNIKELHDQVTVKTIENIKDCGFENNNLVSNIIEFTKYKDKK